MAKKQKVREAITFTEKDTTGFQHIHTDMVVVTLNIDNYNVHRVLLIVEV